MILDEKTHLEQRRGAYSLHKDVVRILRMPKALGVQGLCLRLFPQSL